MIIESVELDNFKSFGKKVTVAFKPGFTVITGPNGSGKSNIGDAMLFVLGIRSSKAIRVDRLPDLVHKNTDGSNIKRCMVTLNMVDTNENGDQYRTQLAREIVIGNDNVAQSSYYINGSKVRRSDVEQFLDNSQLYLDAYSFVLQGDINNLIKMTGTERRKLLESIAGIESYNVQIENSEKYISGLNENLGKLEVLQEESQKRVELLHVEKESAERFIELDRNIKDYEATLTQREIISLQREIEAYRKNQVEAEEQITKEEERIKQIQAEISTIREKLDAVKKERESVAAPELKSIENKISNLTVEKAKVEIKIDGKSTEAENLENKLQMLEESLQESQQHLDSLTGDYNIKKKEKDETENRLKEINTTLESMRSEGDQKSKKVQELRQKITDLESSIESSEKELNESNGELNRLEVRKNVLITELSGLQEEQESHTLARNDAKYRLEEINRDSSSRRSSLDKLNKRYYEVRNRIKALSEEKDSHNSELRELTREYEKLNASANPSGGAVTRSLSIINARRSSGELTGVMGTVRELITYDDTYSSAVKSAAGGRLNAVVVDSDETAEKCLDALKREKGGRLTFLPLNKMVQGRPRGKAIMVKNSGQSEGYLFEKISIDEKYSSVIWYVFQDTLLMKDVRTARMHMGGVRLVTLDGDIFEASGAITGGYSGKSSGSLDARDRIARISARINEINSLLESVNSELDDLNVEFDDLTEKLKSESRTEGQSGSDTSKFEEIISKSDSSLSQLGGQISTREKELENLNSSISDLTVKCTTLTEEIEKQKEEKKKTYGELDRSSPEMFAKITELETEKEGLLQNINELSQVLSDTGSDMNLLKSDLKRMAEDKVESTSMRSEALSLMKDLEKEMAGIQEEVDKLRLLEESMNAHLKEYDDKILSLNSEIETLNGDIETRRYSISSKRETLIVLEGKISNSVTKLSEQEELLVSGEGSPMDTELSNTEIKSGISRAKSEIQSLGPINHRAIVEYEEEKSKLIDLDERISKLLSEKKDVEELMEKLNNEKRRAFTDLYEKINTNMGEIYTRLSEGGEAQLAMTGSDDPLDCEVHIKARPKGKTLRKIDSLSGGEKSLTAIAFILAVQRIKPSPVYYLDEIDMFLDGSNAERIGRMFAENSNYSQILMVSLKKAMLKYSDQLIGVTTMDGKNSEIFTKELEEVEDAR